MSMAAGWPLTTLADAPSRANFADSLPANKQTSEPGSFCGIRRRPPALASAIVLRKRFFAEI